MKGKAISGILLIIVGAFLLFSCKENKIITDTNSENELQQILGVTKENNGNGISDIFENSPKADISGAGKNNQVKEESAAQNIQIKEDVSETVVKDREIPMPEEKQEVKQEQEIKQTQGTQENIEQKEIKPYNDIYVVINETQYYHRIDCEKLVDENFSTKSFYTSKKELYFNGFKPCEECRPDI